MTEPAHVSGGIGADCSAELRDRQRLDLIPRVGTSESAVDEGRAGCVVEEGGGGGAGVG